MGRFTSLEINNRTEVPPDRAPAGGGEAIKNAQYFLDCAERDFFRMEHENALREFSRALAADPGSAAAWQGQALSLISLDELHEADVMITRALEMVGETPDLLALRALAAARSGKFDRACGYSDASLEAGGQSPLPLVVRGELFSYSRGSVETCLDQAVAAPGEMWKNRLLAVDSCLYVNTRKSVTLGHYYLLPALEKHPTRPELYLRLALIRIRFRDRKAARLALDQAAALDGTLEMLPLLRSRAARCTFWRRWFGR